MSTINTSDRFKAEVEALTRTVDQLPSQKAVNIVVEGVFGRVAPKIPVTPTQQKECEHSLKKLEIQLKRADLTIEERAWDKMGKTERFFKSILWGVSHIAKLFGGTTYRATKPLDIPKLTQLVRNAKAKLQVSAQQIKESPRSQISQHSPASVVVQLPGAKAISVPTTPRKSSAEEAAPPFVITVTPSTPPRQPAAPPAPPAAAPEPMPQVMIRQKIDPKKQNLADCAACKAIISELIQKFPKGPATLTQSLQKKYLETMLQEQTDIAKAIMTTKRPEVYVDPEINLKITIPPQEMQDVCRERLQKIASLIGKFEKMESNLQTLHPGNLPANIRSERFTKQWTDIHATLTALLDSIRPDLNMINVRAFPFQDQISDDNAAIEKIKNTSKALYEIIKGIDEKNFRERHRKLDELTLQLASKE